MQWHKEWFQEEGWWVTSMDLLHGIETQDMAYLVFDSRYDKSETRKFRLLVAIVLVREQQCMTGATRAKACARNVVGMVLRATTGKPYAEYLDEKLWVPLDNYSI